MILRGAARLARVAGLALTLLGPTAAGAQQAATPGAFAYYVLSLSWSPTYCESRDGKNDSAQCGGRPYAFVVHGLWPQNENGWPESCQNPAPYVPESVVRSMLDVMPSRKLVIHEWRKHGTCSGLDATAYFNLVRKARAAVIIPTAFQHLDDYKMVSPQEVESAFRQANPGLSSDMIAVDCDSRRLREVRVCLDKSLGFTSCAAVDRRSCRTPRIVMPPVRGG